MAEDVSPLTPSAAEISVLLGTVLVMASVFVASYRRNRYLAGRPVPESLLIGLVSAAFWPVWVAVSLLTWRTTRQRWHEARSPGQLLHV